MIQRSHLCVPVVCGPALSVVATNRPQLRPQLPPKQETIPPAAAPVAGTPAEKSAPEDPDTEKLLTQLVETSEPGFGYSVFFSGSEFLAYENTGKMGTLVLGAAHASRSDSLRDIVKKGVAAVPTLLKHINDDRPTKMKPVSGMMWMDFPDEYDFNRRIRKTAPVGVNQDHFKSDKDHPSEHTVTVGDLCFVALGQIVNREFNAVRYQPTGGLIVSSPTYSESLRKTILADWRTLSAESHKRLLIDDFLKPDHEARRTGAYLRLAFYYPEAVEELVVNELSKPTYDVFVIEETFAATVCTRSTTK